MLGLPSTLSCGQKDLADNGIRSWDYQIMANLDDNYPDWKNPTATHMVPAVFTYKKRNLDNGENTEKEFFNLLQKFGETRPEPMFVVHSHNFNEHISELEHGSLKSGKSWVMGEHDFVLIHRLYGLVFFQVKASIKTVAKFKEAEKQLDKDNISLKIFANRFKSKLKRGITDALNKHPGFVVMPNCNKPNSPHAPPNGLFKENCKSVEDFAEWWDKFIVFGRQETIDEQVFQELVMRFVGFVHMRPCLSNCIDASHRVLIFETTEQLKLRMESVSEQWVTGPAGSGKTCLIIGKVQMLAERILIRNTEEKILILCYNRPLSMMFKKTFEASSRIRNLLQGKDLTTILDIKTFYKLLFDINGRTMESYNKKEYAVMNALECSIPTNLKYDHIFVDEGQDLFGEWPNLLKKLHISNGDLIDDVEDLDQPKYFWVMYDSNQHLHLLENQNCPHFSSLKNSMRLSKVLRNTEHIFKQSMKYFKPLLKPCSPFDIGHREVGLPIKWDDSSTTTSGVDSVVKNIQDLLRDAVQPQDICILASDVRERDALMMDLQSFGITCQNAEDNIVHAQSKVVVESIRRFKGLESKVVLLFRPRFTTKKESSAEKTIELLYTAVSRCCCYLVVISNPLGCKVLQSEEGIMESEMRNYVVQQMQVANSEDLSHSSGKKPRLDKQEES